MLWPNNSANETCFLCTTVQYMIAKKRSPWVKDSIIVLESGISLVRDMVCMAKSSYTMQMQGKTVTVGVSRRR